MVQTSAHSCDFICAPGATASLVKFEPTAWGEYYIFMHALYKVQIDVEKEIKRGERKGGGVS